MKRTKQNKKRSTVVAIVVAVACIAALIGATFAWFTDTASTATNKIQAGNLDVDLIMDKKANGTYTSIAGETAAIFGTGTSLVAQNDSAATIWEPGKTQIVYLGVKNAGNLALKYTIELTVKDNGLADALEYAFIADAKASNLTSVTDWSTLKAKATQTGSVTAGTIQAAPNGLLDEIAKTGEQGETDYFVLAIHMKEDAGNDYKSKSADIDVTIKATQAAAESDSFSNEYDKNATYEASAEDNDPYLTFSSDAAFSLGGYIYVSGLQYSTDTTNWFDINESQRDEWGETTHPDPIDAVQNGDKYYIYLRGNGLTTLLGSNSTTLTLNATEDHTVDCSGNIMTLLDHDNPNGVKMEAHAFDSLFYGCTSLATAPSLPATTLTTSCYRDMFHDCTSLTSAPDLPATDLTDAVSCYAMMFMGCESLVSTPVLPAEKLAEFCYSSMFQDCTSLASASALPAETLAEGCYSDMFARCTSLVSAPTISAKTLAEQCCYRMFSGCSLLASAPVLSATTLEEGCYSYMFSDCTKLKVTTASSAYATKIFTCPSTDGLEWPVDGMFASTGGTFTSTPTKGTTYYWYTEE